MDIREKQPVFQKVPFQKAMSLLNVSRNTLERAVKEGVLEKFYFGGKTYLDLSQIEKAFTKNQQ